MKVLLIIEVVLEVERLWHIILSILSILDDDDDEEVPFMKVILIIEVVLVFLKLFVSKIRKDKSDDTLA